MSEAKRKLTSWIDAFIEYSETKNTPPIFRRWAGIACLAGALERKVWVTIRPPDPLYPNLYTTLIAPPGVGKTDIIKLVREFWKTLKSHHVAKSSMSRAALSDALNHAERSEVVERASKVITYNALLIASNELTVLIPSYDSEFMGTLNDLYDGYPYGEKKRTTNLDYEIEHPNLNIIAASSPSYLKELMPEGAWDQGFISRLFMIYAPAAKPQDLFRINGTTLSAFGDLEADLKTISKLYGEVKFTAEAARAFNNWHMAGGPPAPEHPRTQHYVTRRTAHLAKLCTIACVSESDKLLITVEHYNQALSWLLEMEYHLPDVFKAMAGSGETRKLMEETWMFVYKLYMRKNDPVTSGQLHRYILERLPNDRVDGFINNLLKAQVIKEVPNSAGRAFVPHIDPKRGDP